MKDPTPCSLAAPRERGAEYIGQRHAQERRANVGPIVDVLLKGAPLAGRALPTTHESDRINLNQQSRSAALRLNHRVENMRLAEAKVEHLRMARVLVQEVAQIRG